MAKVGFRKISLRFSRNQFFVILLFCFLFPVMVTGYFALVRPEALFWIASLTSLIGGYLGFLLLKYWERRMRRAVEALVEKKSRGAPIRNWDEIERNYQSQIDLLQTSLTESHSEVNELKLEMDRKLSEMHHAYLEFEDLRREYRRIDEEYQLFKKESEEKFEKRQAMLAEYQTTIFEQRGIIEKKQLYVSQLEGKVRDLMYEIRSLLQLDEPITDALPPIDMLNREEVEDYYLGNQMPSFDVDLQLSRYVDMAERFTGAEHLGYLNGKGPRFLDSQSYAIDLRRLFDMLRDEATGIIFFYSMTEKKILFANNYVKTLLGYSSEKFASDFPLVVKAGYQIWREALERIESTKRMPLILLNRKGEELKLECQMKVITKGPFVGQVIGMITD